MVSEVSFKRIIRQNFNSIRVHFTFSLQDNHLLTLYEAKHVSLAGMQIILQDLNISVVLSYIFPQYSYSIGGNRVDIKGIKQISIWL